MFLNLRPEGGILRLVSSVRRVHPAWVVLGAVTLCMMAGSGIRSTFGVYIKPMEAEFGWGRGALSGAAAISLLLLGAAGPLVGRLADRYGPRRIVTASLLLLGAGSVSAAFVQSLWHVYVTIGLFLALGAGGLSTPTAATVAARLSTIAPRTEGQPSGGGGDRLLTAREAAVILNLSTDFLYKHEAAKAFRVRIGNEVRFSLAGIQRFIERHRGR